MRERSPGRYVQASLPQGRGSFGHRFLGPFANALRLDVPRTEEAILVPGCRRTPFPSSTRLWKTKITRTPDGLNVSN